MRLFSDSYTPYSPYNYVLGNPIQLIDPDGRSTESIHKDVDGNVIAEIDDGDNNVYVHKDLGGNGQHIDGQISLLKQKREIYGTGGGGEVDKVASVMNKISKFFGEGDQQQHSGENWFIYGKGSANGRSIQAPKPDPDGVNKSIDISEMFPGGGGFGPNINPIRGLGGFNDRVNSVVDRLSDQTQIPKPENDTIYNCGACKRTYRDSSGAKIRTAPNSKKPQKNIKTHH